MFEATMVEASLLKKIVEATKDLVQNASFDCGTNSFSMQAMDVSHVSLCYLVLNSDGFDRYRCDRPRTLGLNLGSLHKILKCSSNNDQLIIKAEDEGDVATFVFENRNQDKIIDFEMKLMSIDAEHLGIPDQEYACVVSLPSGEFQRIINDLDTLGEACVIEVTKEGVRFSTSGDIGKANIVLKQNRSSDKEDDEINIKMKESVKLTFALRYLKNFTKATGLSKKVTLSMSKELPMVVEYKIDEEAGQLRYYLAPKIDENDDDEDEDDEMEEEEPVVKDEVVKMED